MKTDEIFDKWCGNHKWAANSPEIRQYYCDFAEFVLQHQTNLMLGCLRNKAQHSATCDV
jgi:hypothetical protein